MVLSAGPNGPYLHRFQFFYLYYRSHCSLYRVKSFRCDLSRWHHWLRFRSHMTLEYRRCGRVCLYWWNSVRVLPQSHSGRIGVIGSVVFRLPAIATWPAVGIVTCCLPQLDLALAWASFIACWPRRSLLAHQRARRPMCAYVLQVSNGCDSRGPCGLVIVKYHHQWIWVCRQNKLHTTASV